MVEGSSPQLLTDFMEVRGLGIVNVSVRCSAPIHLKRNMPLSLIINLVTARTSDNKDQTSTVSAINRIHVEYSRPRVSGSYLAGCPGRNLAVLVEARRVTTCCRTNDYNAAQDLIARQNHGDRRANGESAD